MTSRESFQSQLEALPVLLAADPARFGPGVRMLLSCGSKAILPALAEAEARGIEARGVGRMHILVEIEGPVPDAAWVASKGRAIADYFTAIGGTDPQIGFDRNFD